MDPSRFFTHSLQDARVASILAAALEAVDPGKVVERYLQRETLPVGKRVFVFAVGKGAMAMTRALARFTNLVRGLVVSKHASQRTSGLPACVKVIAGGHPVPDENSLAGGMAALEFVSSLQADDLLVCLISGGGSALMSAPYVPLPDLQALTSALLASGAPIDEINTLRRHLDRVKGGGLARATRAHVLSLVLSDVVNNPLEVIASGPTAPDPTTKADALAVLKKYHLEDRIPGSIPACLQTESETPKPGEPLFDRVQHVIVGDNALAVKAALERARREGFRSEYLGSDWQGEARQVGRQLAEKLRVVNKTAKSPCCLIAGGETTVTLRGDGRGGRNQELALSAVPALDGLENTMLIALATDGEDGPTDAAGAVATGETIRRATALGLDPAAHLARNDAYPFFAHLGDLLKIGPTGTNVNDLVFLFRNL